MHPHLSSDRLWQSFASPISQRQKRSATFLCTLGLKWKNIKKPVLEVANSAEGGEIGEKSG